MPLIAVSPPDAWGSLRQAIAPTRNRLLSHPIYQQVDSLPALRQFMQTHVFAVWDFMCLVKRLQRDLTSIDRLWLPPKRPSLARFINGVVYGEESDVDPDGKAASHLDIYLAAMEEVGASTATIRRFLAALSEEVSVKAALAQVDAPAPARTFVAHTLGLVEHGRTLDVLAAFLFGREDLIPDMFSRLLPRWEQSRKASRFTYYVQRHIALDGDDHGPAGQRALIELLGRDPAAWRSAQRAAEEAMRQRIALWDGIAAGLS